MRSLVRVPVPDWNKRVEIDIGTAMTHQSKWGSTAGVRLDNYFDVDSIFAVDYTLEEGHRSLSTRKAFIREILSQVNRIIEEFNIDRVAFIDKNGMGPVGGIWLALSTGIELNTKIMLVRPAKELISARLKGENPKPGEKFLVLTDVITTGGTLIEVEKVIRMFGAKVLAAYAVIDRDDENVVIKRNATLHDKYPIFSWRKASAMMQALSGK